MFLVYLIPTSMFQSKLIQNKKQRIKMLSPYENYILPIIILSP